MNNLRNKVQLIGHVGNNPEVKSTSNGRSMAKFSLATRENYKNQQGEKVDETYWHYITVWGKNADFAGKYIQKGQELAIEGKLHPKMYNDKDGNKRFSVEIIVNELVLLGKKEK